RQIVAGGIEHVARFAAAELEEPFEEVVHVEHRRTPFPAGDESRKTRRREGVVPGHRHLDAVLTQATRRSERAAVRRHGEKERMVAIGSQQRQLSNGSTLGVTRAGRPHTWVVDLYSPSIV